MPLVASALAVLLGGALGTAARALLDAAIADWWTLLAINASGSLLLGLATAAIAGAPAWVRHGVGAGLLGGFTTFSAIAVASVSASAASAGWGGIVPALPGIAIALGQLVVCLVAAWAGLDLGRRIARSRAGGAA